MKLIISITIIVLSCWFEVCETGTISYAHQSFETFSPKSLIRFFEFNDFGFNISADCVKDLYVYLDALQKDIKWAYRLFDASGQYNGGLFYGQNWRTANPMQCDGFNDELNFIISENREINNTLIYVPFFVQTTNAKFTTYVDSQKREIIQTLCLPTSCTFDDLVQVLSFVPLSPEPTEILKNTELSEIRILYQIYKFYSDRNFYIIVAISAFNFGVSIYAFYFHSKSKRLNHEKLKFKRNISCHQEIKITGEAKLSNIISSEKSDQVQENNLNVQRKHHVGMCKHKVKNFQMGSAETLTISSKNCNQLNLVKVQKNKVNNTLTLDIISANCNSSSHSIQNQLDRDAETQSDIAKFSFEHQLLDSTPSDLPFLVETNIIHTIRFYSLIWLILLVVLTDFSYASNNKRYLDEDTNWLVYLIFKNGGFAIDSWFFINGFLVTQLFFKSSKDLNITNLKNIAQHFEHFFFLVIYKIFRLVVPFFIIIKALSLLAKHTNENSVLSVPSNDHITCDSNILNQLIFSTYVSYSQRCGLWTWYLSLELQFFFISILVLMISRNHPYFAFTLFSSFYVSTFFITTAQQVDVQVNSILNFTDQEKLLHFNGIYDHPLNFVGPYIIGIFFGYCIYKYDGRIKINSVIKLIGWMSSVSLFCLLMFSSYKMGDLNPWLKHSFINLSHLFWALILLWICFSTSKSGGTNKVFSKISRISNSVYLTAPFVVRAFILSSNNPIFVSVQLIIIAFVGFIVICFVAAVLFYLLFDAPIITLLHIIYGKLVDKFKTNNPV